jgi:hypothetical protein
MPASLRADSRLGVGIDLAERRTFSHLAGPAIRRAAARWLGPPERAWCAAQPSFREAVVTVLSCKEAVYKAWGASGQTHELSLTMHGRGTSGWAVKAGHGPGQVVASWTVAEGSILAVAVAAPAGCRRHLVAGVVLRLTAALPRRVDQSILPRCRDTSPGGPGPSAATERANM